MLLILHESTEGRSAECPRPLRRDMLVDEDYMNPDTTAERVAHEMLIGKPGLLHAFSRVCVHRIIQA